MTQLSWCILPAGYCILCLIHKQCAGLQQRCMQMKVPVCRSSPAPFEFIWKLFYYYFFIRHFCSVLTVIRNNIILNWPNCPVHRTKWHLWITNWRNISNCPHYKAHKFIFSQMGNVISFEIIFLNKIILLIVWCWIQVLLFIIFTYWVSSVC
jgi:hypothetical protein